jgi:hypothetical protein
MGFLENQTSINDKSSSRIGQDTSINIGLRDPDKNNGKPGSIEVNVSNPFAAQDYHKIIQTYESETTSWVEEDYALATHYKDVYSTRNFSERVRGQMDYYPGMHQSSSPPKENPFLKNAKEDSANRMNSWNNAMSSPESFMNGLRSRQKDFDYTKIFGSDVSAKTRAENMGKMLTECVPCFNRLIDKNNLLPNGDILQIHALNIRLRTDFIDELKKLFGDPGMYIDICELLKLFASLCPQDLIAILALLTQYLTKINLDIKFNMDFMINLVGPILSPFLDGLSQWLDKWVQLIIEPLLCVVDHVNEVIITAQKIPIAIKDARYSGNVDMGLNTNLIPDVPTVGTQVGFVSDNRDNTAWSGAEAYRYEKVELDVYDNPIPEYPVEELSLAGQETREEMRTFAEKDFGDAGYQTSPEKRKELDQRWAAAKKKQEERKKKKQEIETERKARAATSAWEDSYKKPENRAKKPDEAYKYWDPSPLISSIVQLRNIIQGGIQYVKDWFTFLTQMIYDLLGVELGWMSKKTGTSYLKTNIIQLIAMVKSILESISKNGLECGTNNNFGTVQMRDILEDGLNKFSQTKFKVADDGTITMYPAGKPVDIKDLSNDIKKKIERKPIDSGVGQVEPKPNTEAEMRERVKESGIIIKSCLKDVSSEELAKVRSWISDFERRSS